MSKQVIEQVNLLIKQIDDAKRNDTIEELRFWYDIDLVKNELINMVNQLEGNTDESIQM